MGQLSGVKPFISHFMTNSLAAASLTLGCSSPLTFGQIPEKGWGTLDAGAFALSAPQGWEFHEEQGIDSMWASSRVTASNFILTTADIRIR